MQSNELRASRCFRRLAAVRAAWVAGALAASGPASAAEPANSASHLGPAAAPSEEPAQLGYASPRAALIPGTPGMPGGIHLMLNGFGFLHNSGLGAHVIANQAVATHDGGATIPLLVSDWAMAYGRDSRGYVEGLAMLNFEPLTVGPEGYPELGQAGEGLWDAQHSHQLVHQLAISVHPLAGLPGWHPENMMTEGRADFAVFFGQGSATIGPPIFMHRASSPGPTVPRKHHKGENPHETFPVIGTQLRVGDTWFESSVFSAKELLPSDSRNLPQVGAPSSIAARVRHTFGSWLELQVSGERLRDQGHGQPDAFQASASAYAWGNVRGFRFDGLLDWAADVADAAATEPRHSAQALLAEVAVRSPSRRDTVWLRSEINQREESAAAGGGVTSPWLFETLGAERVVLGGASSGLQLGLFGEATAGVVPEALEAMYGRRVAVSVNLGFHVFGMWMLDGDLNRMTHHGAQ